MTEDEFVAELSDGMTIGIGGWGLRRKPMALVRAIARSSLKDLTVVSYGGPDVGLLCRTGKIRKLVYGFVSLDVVPLEPNFRRARQSGELEISELDEGMLQWGLYAAALRLPFLPSRAGLGSDVLSMNPDIKTVRSPYPNPNDPKGQGEELVAVPAIALDAALVHMHRADPQGTGQCLGLDPYFDDLFAMAARKTFMSCERVVNCEDFLKEGPAQSLCINRMFTTGVIETPQGAHFTECLPDYNHDVPFVHAYVRAASSTDQSGWREFAERYVMCPDHDTYRATLTSDSHRAFLARTEAA
jgi:glutaconate CoA-transferase subunit A